MEKDRLRARTVFPVFSLRSNLSGTVSQKKQQTDDKTTRTKQREPCVERVHGIQDDSNVGAGVGAVDEGPGGLRRLELADENLRSRRPATLEERDETRSLRRAINDSR